MSPTPRRPPCCDQGGGSPLTPSQGLSEGLPRGRTLHTPVRGEGLPVLLPPGGEVHGGDVGAEEPHQLPQGRLHQRGLRAHPGKGAVRLPRARCQRVPSWHGHWRGQAGVLEATLQKPVDSGICPANPLPPKPSTAPRPGLAPQGHRAQRGEGGHRPGHRHRRTNALRLRLFSVFPSPSLLETGPGGGNRCSPPNRELLSPFHSKPSPPPGQTGGHGTMNPAPPGPGCLRVPGVRPPGSRGGSAGRPRALDPPARPLAGPSFPPYPSPRLGKRGSPGGGAVGGWCWPPRISAQSGGAGPRLRAPGPFSGGLGVVPGPGPVLAGLPLAPGAAATTSSVGALAGPGPGLAGCVLSPPAAAHALLLRGKVVGVAVAATVPEAVAPAHGGDEVPAGGPVCAGAQGAGQQAPHGVG